MATFLGCSEGLLNMQAKFHLSDKFWKIAAVACLPQPGVLPATLRYRTCAKTFVR